MKRAVLVVAVVLAIAGVVFGVFFGGLESGDELWPVSWMMWAPVGAVILWRRPGNGVGMAMLFIGLCSGIDFFVLALAESAAPFDVRVWADLASAAVFGVLPWMGIVWIVLVFPTGRLEGRLERITGLGLVALAVVGVFAFAVSPEPLESTGVPSPLTLSWMERATAWFVSESGFIVVLVVLIAALVSLARRWRASSGIERHQYRWLLLGTAVFAGTLGVGQVIPEGSPAELIWLAGGFAIPVAIGVAVTRHRLYEIDRIISRTVSYTLVVGVLALVSATGVVWIPSALGLRDTPLLVAGSTLAVAAMFNPLRKRVQRWVDRRFNRSKYDAERVMDEFAGALRDRIDPDGVVDGWVGVVSETMQPSSVGVWVRSART